MTNTFINLVNSIVILIFADNWFVAEWREH